MYTNETFFIFKSKFVSVKDLLLLLFSYSYGDLSGKTETGYSPFLRVYIRSQTTLNLCPGVDGTEGKVLATGSGTVGTHPQTYEIES